MGVGLGAGVGGLSVWDGMVTGATWLDGGESRLARGWACLADCGRRALAFLEVAGAVAEPTAEPDAEPGGDCDMAGGDGGQRMPGHWLLPCACMLTADGLRPGEEGGGGG